MRPAREALDVSGLPTVTFGHRAIMWWGTVGFMLIEGTALGICAAAYLYLRRNFDAWPPPRTPDPDLLWPTVNLAVMAASLGAAVWADRAAHRFDLRRVRRALVLSSIAGLVILGVRGLEFGALHTRWDSDAYGSITWTILGLHTSLLVVDVAETIAFTLILFVRPTRSYIATTTENSMYWYFVVGIWVPLYALLYWAPRMT